MIEANRARIFARVVSKAREASDASELEAREASEVSEICEVLQTTCTVQLLKLYLSPQNLGATHPPPTKLIERTGTYFIILMKEFC